MVTVLQITVASAPSNPNYRTPYRAFRSSSVSSGEAGSSRGRRCCCGPDSAPGLLRGTTARGHGADAVRRFMLHEMCEKDQRSKIIDQKLLIGQFSDRLRVRLRHDLLDYLFHHFRCRPSWTYRLPYHQEVGKRSKITLDETVSKMVVLISIKSQSVYMFMIIIFLRDARCMQCGACGMTCNMPRAILY